jgi:prolyl oligopeptidase
MRHGFPLVLLALLLIPGLATGDPALRGWDYPAAPRGQVIDDYHGVKVADPFRPLEDLDSPQTKAWVAAENALTLGFLAKLPQRSWFHDRLTRLWDYPRYGLPFKEGGLYFFTKNDGLQNQPVLYVQPSLRGTPRVLLDPNTLSADGTVALAAAEVSHDGRWLAYATAAAGSDWNEFRVRDVASGRDNDEVLRWIKFSEPSWTRDCRGFFYARFAAPSSATANSETFSELSNQKIYYHRIGTPQSDDRLIFEIPDEPKWLMGAEVTEDGRYAVISIEKGDSNFNLLRYIPLGDPGAPDVAAPVRILVGAWDAEYAIIGSSGPVLYVQTNRDAPRNRIVAIDTRAPEPAHWTTLVPQGPDTIESSAVLGGKLVVLALHDASSRIFVYSLDGSPVGQIPLPGLGSVASLSGHADDPEMFFNFTSFTQPTSNFRHDLSTGGNELFQAPKVGFDPAGYETRQIFYSSKDGTRVPMFITARKGLKLDGKTPTLLYAYGGFDIPMKPAFSIPNLAWLEMGGIYAMPNLRGGGEYGREWHEAGTKERKQNVFDDYIAAAEWLFAHGYTSPGHLVISGGSNGGLLIGATLNQRPDICRVAWPAVGVMDMLRFQKFTIGYDWVADYGSSDDPSQFRALLAYSPLHTIRKGASYPAVLVTTADHDDRVYPAHSFKYTAAMQASVANGPGSLPVMVRIETRAGHTIAGKPTSKLIDEAADRLAFAAHFLDLHPEKQ